MEGVYPVIARCKERNTYFLWLPYNISLRFRRICAGHMRRAAKRLFAFNVRQMVEDVFLRRDLSPAMIGLRGDLG